MSRVALYACALATSTALLFIVSAVGAGSQAQTQQFFDAGQERLAIFPVYDGYRKNEDGSLTLSFAYFSHNATPVEIQPGENNFFSSTADIGQPTVFLPGHHRWQCIVVVDPDFDGDLRWTLTHAGSTTSTSESMLQYNWEFSERDERNVLRAIEDPTVEPRDVCLNRPPIVRVLGYGGPTGASELKVAVGEGLKLFGSVRDEGLPKEGTVASTWHKVSGPGTVRFDDAHSPRTLAFFSEPGDYIVQLTGTDSLLENMTEVNVVVSR